MRNLTVLAVALLALVLVACGGGDDDAASDPSDKDAADGEIHARPVATYAYPVQMFDDDAPEPGDPSPRHVDIGAATYSTDPPTSGQHFGGLVQSSVQGEGIADEILVHNMEHGYVIIWYNCGAEPPLSADDCATLRTELTSVVTPMIARHAHVVVAPDATMTPRIALTSWQFMDSFDEFDSQRIETFVDTFECHYDPESTCNA